MSISRGTSTTIRVITGISTRTTTPKRLSEPLRLAATTLWLSAAWTLFAFGGAYPWTTAPLIAASVVVAVAVRPRLFRRHTRTLDLALCMCLAAALVQLLPLSAPLRLALSPATATVDRALRLDAPLDPADGPARPLSVDPESGIQAVVLAASVIVVFWTARHVYAAGGRRRTVRAIGACGLVVSAVSLAQHVVAPHLLYGIWRPESRNAQFPFGPFVNRNDLAAWIVMALPLVIGYFAARLETRRRQGLFDVEALFDGSGAWLAIGIGLMAAALVSTLSRSGLIGGLSGAVALVLLTRSRIERQGRGWLIAGLSLVALVAAAYANVGALTTRVGETLDSGVGGRREIWQTTIVMLRDFWRTGVGVGAFERAMSVYQPPHLFAFNHAHDEYLQVAVEGGLLLAVPALLAAASAVWRIGRLVREDRTSLFWIRAGAASSLAAIGVQSVWETGLRMPANAVLFALCAALAVHEPCGGNEGDGGDGGNGDGGNGEDGGNGKSTRRNGETERRTEQGVSETPDRQAAMACEPRETPIVSPEASRGSMVRLLRLSARDDVMNNAVCGRHGKWAKNVQFSRPAAS